MPKKFRQKNQELPKVKDKLKNRHVPISRLEQVTPEIISNFIQERIINDNISPKTANRLREVLHRMFSYASDQCQYVCPDKRFRNPVQGVKRTKETAPIITWLTLEDVEEQLKVLELYPVIHAMVAIYIYAGLRREEGIWLTCEDVDMRNRLIRVQAKKIEGEFWQPKTKRNRVVPISEALFNVLNSYELSDGCIWFFPSPSGMRWNPDNFSTDLRDINAVNGLNWSCLDFRHTFGSHLAQNGVSLYQISTLMGNSPEICRRHYAALIPEKMSELVEFHQNTEPDKNDNETKKMLDEILQTLKGAKEPTSKLPHLRLVKPTDSA